MTQLPVREIVLYKHGVGFFIREGQLSGDSLNLTFKQEEVNDILKSLTVIDRAGGQVLGIHYQTPMDKAARLASSSIRLGDFQAFRDLLLGLRGRSITLHTRLEALDQFTEIEGRVVGVDDWDYDQRAMERATVSILQVDNTLAVIRLSDVQSLRLHDDQSIQDLDYSLSTMMSEDARRSVTVQLTPGEHHLLVQYVAPAPLWRVSYRLVAASEAGETKGQALLQGWGLFDNRLDEDLNAVQVTLVAGQPISFIYDLYASRIPERPMIKDEPRIAPDPIEAVAEYDSFMASPADERVRGITLPTFMRAKSAAGGVRAAPPKPEEVAASTMTSAQGSDIGELFQYVVTNPVTVKRGESALVPIVGMTLPYDRELLYNRQKLAHHPVATIRIENTTGLTLERGPITVVENGNYIGEAILPYTKPTAQLHLPYAVELGVQVHEHFHTTTETASLHIKDALFIFEQYETSTIQFRLENTLTKPVVVTLEEAILPQWVLFETPTPDVETATEQRWRVSIPARSHTEFTLKRRLRQVRREDVRKLEYKKLQEYAQNRWLKEDIIQQLQAMLDTMIQITTDQQTQGQLEKNRAKFYIQQEQLRANLGALSSTGDEAGLRKRMLAQLETTQNQLEALEREVEQLTQQIARAEQHIKDILATLG
jgi:hypothetical protein